MFCDAFEILKCIALLEYKLVNIESDHKYTNGQALKVRVYRIRFLSNLFKCF
jgi:hypothetical protein